MFRIYTAVAIINFMQDIVSDIKLLGKKIAEIRKSKGFTQDALSEKIGIDPKHLSRVECGKNRPSLELLYKISLVLAVDMSLFFQNSHLQERDELIEDIDKLLSEVSTDKLRIYYKVLRDIAI